MPDWIIITEDNALPDLNQTITILGTGAVAALVYAFSDTFWFSAVEGEVYATSSLFTAVVFWAILKWENEADQKYANRWLILIAYLMGLSIGVHLLNLLTIPAVVFIYYFRKFEITRNGVTSIIHSMIPEDPSLQNRRREMLSLIGQVEVSIS